MAILKFSPLFHFRFSPKEELIEYDLLFLRRLRQRQRQDRSSPPSLPSGRRVQGNVFKEDLKFAAFARLSAR